MSRFNRWYDGLKEPWRFFFFLVVLMGWLPLMFVSAPSPVIHGIASVWMTLTMLIALSRIR